MDNNSIDDITINNSLFTAGQKEYLYKNYDNLLRYKHERKLVEKTDEEYMERSRKVHFYMNQEEVALYNLKPFIDKTNIYTKKVNEIMKANGLEEDDFPNDKARKEILDLETSMREESSKYSDDLKTNLEVKKDFESMFKEDNNENKSDFAKRFK